MISTCHVDNMLGGGGGGGLQIMRIPHFFMLSQAGFYILSLHI